MAPLFRKVAERLASCIASLSSGYICEVTGVASGYWFGRELRRRQPIDRALSSLFGASLRPVSHLIRMVTRMCALRMASESTDR